MWEGSTTVAHTVSQGNNPTSGRFFSLNIFADFGHFHTICDCVPGYTKYVKTPGLLDPRSHPHK